MNNLNSIFTNRNNWLNKIHFDPILLFLVSILSIFGLFILYSASGQSSYLIKRQLIFLLAGFVVMITISQADTFFYKRIASTFYFLTLILLGITLLIAEPINGSKRWLNLYFFNIQISEFMKIALPLFIAVYISNYTFPPKLIHFFITLIAVLIPVFLIFLQPDLGTSIIVAISGLMVIFLAGLSWKVILSTLGSIAAIFPIAWNFILKDYHKQRILILFNPEADLYGSGWNTIQAKTAIGSGGISGKGWQEGTQGQFDFLPESHTDFIIGIIAEELGFIGVSIFFLLYILIILRCLSITYSANNSFDRIVSGALTSILFLYVFINASMVSGMLPVVGIPLPFVSYGGSSIMSLMIQLGIIMSIGTHTKFSPEEF